MCMGLYNNDVLISAVHCKNLEVVKDCIADCVVVNAKDDSNFTALMLAVTGNHFDIAEFLVKNSADVNAKKQ